MVNWYRLAVQDCLEGMTVQQEMMKQLVSALGEVERGKQAGLANFLTEYGSRIAGRPSKEDHARVKAEVRPPGFEVHARVSASCWSVGLVSANKALAIVVCHELSVDSSSGLQLLLLMCSWPRQRRKTAGCVTGCGTLKTRVRRGGCRCGKGKPSAPGLKSPCNSQCLCRRQSVH
jgi:hypothetical protein